MRLIELKLNINLIDNNSLSPIHVAIKKNQTKALLFAHQHNNSILSSNSNSILDLK